MKKIASLKKSNSLNYIESGAIDFYYGLKIETTLSYEELCTKISDKIDESFQNYNNYVEASLKDSMEESIRQNGLENELRIKETSEDNIKDKLSDLLDLKDEIDNLNVIIKDSGFELAPITIVNNYLTKSLQESEFDFNFCKKIYGNFFVESQTRFALPPIKVELKNGSIQLLSSMLFVFNNNTAILRLTLPIDNLDSQPMLLNEIDNYIASAKTIPGFSSKLKDESIQSIKSCYFQYILSIKKVTSVVCSKQITNIILANHSGTIENIKNIPNKIKEDIYKISLAPVPKKDGVSYIEEAKKHLEKNGFFFNGVGYILSSMGRCVSIVDDTVLSLAKEKCDKEIIFDNIIHNLRINVEFSIIILLLKNINDGYTFHKKGLSNSKLSKIKNEYNKNKIFISLLQSEVYGSVRELTDFFEKNMTFFLDKKNVEDRMNALNNILEEEQSNRTLQLQNVVSVVGLIFTFIFGLPAINETLTHIRNLFSFITSDIPFISIEKLSFTIWFIMSLGMCIFVFYKLKIKKYD